MQEAELALHIGVIPLQILLRRCLEQDEHAGCVCAVAVDHRRGVNAVVLRLRHLLEQHLKLVAGVGVPGVFGICHVRWSDVLAGCRIAVGDSLHHALGEEPFKRFVDVDQAAILQRLGEETGVEQVQDRVFDAAHVLLHRQPAVHRLLAEGFLGVVGIGEAQEIPGGTHEGVHGVGFPLGRLAAAGAGHVDPVALLAQGRTALAREINAPGQLHRKVLAGHRNSTAVIAVDDGNRAAPVALA